MSPKSEKSKIARLREQAGLTQAELADYIGVSENTIANWEKGNASKWIRNLNRLCNALSCDLKDLDPEQDSEKAEHSLSIEPLSEIILETVRSYCTAVQSGDKKAAAKIASFAALHNPELRYWLDHARNMISQFQQERQNQPYCETIVNGLILRNLIMQLGSNPPNDISYQRFCHLVKQVHLSQAFLDKYVSFSREDFRRRLILQTWHLTVYVIGWQPGQIVPMHHHGNSLDAIRIIKGEMTHWQLSPEECEAQKIPFEGCTSQEEYSGPSKTYKSGELITINRRYAHQIANQSQQELVTLHFRFGAPPDDDHWDQPNADSQLVFVWNQEEQCQMKMPS